MDMDITAQQHQFISAFIPWCEANGGADYEELSNILKPLGMALSPDQINTIGHTPPPGQPRVAPPGVWVPPSPEEISPPPTQGNAYVTEPFEAPPIRYAAKGLASRVFPSLPRALDQVASRIPGELAHRVEKPGVPPALAGKGEWLEWTWSQFAEEMRAVAKSLIAVGMAPFESVAICGFNHPCWFFMHMGALAANGLSAGTYPTNSPEACAFVAQDARARVVAVDGLPNLRKYLAVKDRLPLVKHVVTWGAEGVPADIKQQHGDFTITYEEFKALGSGVTDEAYDERTKQVETKNCAVLIYTSGTTGNPKGVMASHDSMMIASVGTVHWTEMPRDVHHDILSFLPLSHIAAQVIDVAIPLALGIEGFVCSVTSARPDALKGTLVATLQAVRPTFFFGVPRVYEKFVDGFKAKLAAMASSAPKSRVQLSTFAGEVALAASKSRWMGHDGRHPYGFEVVNATILNGVRHSLGLDRAHLTLTGAAPISMETLLGAAKMGIDIQEVYGMSETAGMGTLATPRLFYLGSSGPVVCPYELKTEHVDGRDQPGEGEICYRGRHVMLGYLRNPEKTRETIDDDGWLHSGDVGRIDESGRLFLTGRIKELIIGAGGENIAPVPIEMKLKELMPAVSNAVMIGDRRKYNTLLLTLRTQQDLETGAYLDTLTAEAALVNPEIKTVAEAQVDPVWKKYIEEGIAKYNAVALSNACKIQKYRVLPTELTLAGGELTGTLKLRRSVVSEKYARLIDEMYDDDNNGRSRHYDPTVPPPEQPSTAPPTGQPTTAPPPEHSSTAPPPGHPSTAPPPEHPPTAPPPEHPSTAPPPEHPSTAPPPEQPSTAPPPEHPSTAPPPEQPSTAPPPEHPSTVPPPERPSTAPPPQQPQPKNRTAAPRKRCVIA